VWLVLVIALVAAYYALWARYLLAGRRFALLYATYGPVPVPMALLPVLAFFSASVWLHSWPVGAAATLLAVGHLTTARTIARAIAD
jgi:hypothetical protein